MRILITNAFLENRTGSEAYCEDVAIALKQRGHSIGFFAPRLGPLAAQLRQAGFPVVDHPADLPWKPEAIHAQHFRPANLAAAIFPDVPMLFICHGAKPPEERASLAPNILQYAAVDLPCAERVVAETGLPPEAVHLLTNGVDLARFRPRSPLPKQAKRALLFSNSVQKDGFGEMLRTVCLSEGIELDIVGSGTQSSTQEPWNLLPQYDLVFGKARCALEAMACGCAVILCDAQGLGPMVTTKNFDGLRPVNFGFLALNGPHEMEAMLRRIRRYDAGDAMAVSVKMRAVGGFDKTVDWLESAYKSIASRGVAASSAATQRFAYGLALMADVVRPSCSGIPLEALTVQERRAHELLRAHRHLLRKIQAGAVTEGTHSKTFKSILKSAGNDLEKRSALLRDADLEILREAISNKAPSKVGWAPMPFVVGAPRSGTTRLRLMLDAHSQLAIPPETGFLAKLTDKPVESGKVMDWFWKIVVEFPAGQTHWADHGLDAGAFRDALLEIQPFTIADGLRCFYKLYAARFGKSQWGDKTPGYVNSMLHIQSLLPEARFIHIVRDGRDVISSLRNQPFAPANDVARLAGFWARQVESGRAQSGLLTHYIEVRFEDLLRNPRPVMERICAFLRLPFEEGMCLPHLSGMSRVLEHEPVYAADGTCLMTKEERLQLQVRSTAPPDLERIGCWKNQLTAGEISMFNAVAGQVCADFGYEV